MGALEELFWLEKTRRSERASWRASSVPPLQGLQSSVNGPLPVRNKTEPSPRFPSSSLECRARAVLVDSVPSRNSITENNDPARSPSLNVKCLGSLMDSGRFGSMYTVSARYLESASKASRREKWRIEKPLVCNVVRGQSHTTPRAERGVVGAWRDFRGPDGQRRWG
jgi:hypothetical protein